MNKQPNDLYRCCMVQQAEIKRLKYIIKEAREYTSKTQMPEGYKKMILEILNKGE